MIFHPWLPFFQIKTLPRKVISWTHCGEIQIGYGGWETISETSLSSSNSHKTGRKISAFTQYLCFPSYLCILRNSLNHLNQFYAAIKPDFYFFFINAFILVLYSDDSKRMRSYSGNEPWLSGYGSITSWDLYLNLTSFSFHRTRTASLVSWAQTPDYFRLMKIRYGYCSTFWKAKTNSRFCKI